MTENRINILDVQDSTPSAPKKQEEKVVYASVSERFIALLIDYGIIFIPFQFITWIWFNVAHPELELWHYLALIGGINGAFILYETIFSCANRMTLGKGLVGIAVVKKDLSGPLGFFRAFLRAIGYYVSGALLLCGFLMAFFDDRHRALHDILCGSVVVQIREKSWMERFFVRLLGSVLLFAFAWTAYSQVFGGTAWLDQYYIRHARKHLQKIALLEEGHKAKYGYYTNDLLRLSLLSGDPVQFQRDTQAVLEPKGFVIGVTKDSYKIRAVAKDKKHTQVSYSSEQY